MPQLRHFLLVLLLIVKLGNSKTIKRLKMDCEEADAPRMRNIGYVMSGYDIYHGNPAPTYDIVDPGFRALIFNTEYSGEMTPDYRYCTPDGISVLSCVGNCDLTFQTDFIFGNYSYNENLSGKVGVGVDVSGAGNKVNGSFSASVGWHHVNEMTENSANMFTMSEAKCCVYSSEMFEFLRPPLHKNFIAGLRTLTEDYNFDTYRRVVKAFGTHYISKTKMGALFGKETRITSESWSYMVEKGWDIDLRAEMSAMFSANMTANVNYNETEREEFDHYTAEQMMYSRGSPPPADGSSLTWANTIIEEPQVLSVTLERLDTLDLGEYVSSAVVTNLGKFLDEYCEALVAEGALQDCNLLTPDPPIPNPRIWSHWSNFGEGTDYKAQECPELQYVEQIKWKYQGHTYGLIDFQMKCSGKILWESPAVGNHDGAWDPVMRCKDEGFKQLTGREDDTWAGLVNMEAKCVGDTTSMSSNDDYRGESNRDLVCKHGRVVGLQVRQKTHHGLTNFRVLCG